MNSEPTKTEPILTRLPLRGLLGNPLADYLEVMRPSARTSISPVHRHRMLPRDVVTLNGYTGSRLARNRHTADHLDRVEEVDRGSGAVPRFAASSPAESDLCAATMQQPG